ncbi:MAG: flippase [Lachnospiraceae bacterium]|nr:flippase [Lachnospiraceae bacterium]
MKVKSLKINVILNMIRTIMQLIFPLITFPYASRVLGTESLGKVNFTTSVISYFVLIASLGINSYAIREGASLRENRDKFEHFANEIFSINVISTFITYVLMFITFLLVPKFRGGYLILLLIQSTNIAFTTLGVDWIYNIHEEYLYITIRSICVQLISMVALFVFIHGSDDYIKYAIVTVISGVGANIFNFFHSKKFCHLKLTFARNLKKHLPPIFTIFFTNVATTIYVNSDTTMLGFWFGDTVVGLYSVASRLYSMIKMVFAAIISSVQPRLSAYAVQENKEKYMSTINDLFAYVLLLVFPATTGLFLLSENIILLVSGSAYVQAEMALKLLSFALVFACLAGIFAGGIFLPMKKEKITLKATVFGSVINIVLNVLFIPEYRQDGAALATAIAEGGVLVICVIYGHKYVKIKEFFLNLLQGLVGCVGIVIVINIIEGLELINFFFILLSVLSSIVCYGMVLLLLKNKYAFKIVEQICGAFRNKVLKSKKN